LSERAEPAGLPYWPGRRLHKGRPASGLPWP
jgi:hypothetical protein